jgi:hypothetical protein
MTYEVTRDSRHPRGIRLRELTTDELDQRDARWTCSGCSAELTGRDNRRPDLCELCRDSLDTDTE